MNQPINSMFTGREACESVVHNATYRLARIFGGIARSWCVEIYGALGWVSFLHIHNKQRPNDKRRKIMTLMGTIAKIVSRQERGDEYCHLIWNNITY